MRVFRAGAIVCVAARAVSHIAARNETPAAAPTSTACLTGTRIATRAWAAAPKKGRKQDRQLRCRPQMGKEGKEVAVNPGRPCHRPYGSQREPRQRGAD